MNQTRTKLFFSHITDIPRIWWRSITDLQIYRSLIHLPLSFGVLYLLATYAVLASASTVVFTFRTLPALQTTAEQTWNEVRQNWPSDLTLRYQNEQLSAQKGEQPTEQPFTVPYPNTISFPETFPPYLAWVDTTVAAEDESVTSPSEAALFAVTRDRFVVQPNTVEEINEANSFAWSEIFTTNEIEINAATLDEYRDSVFSTINRALRWLIAPYFFVAWLGTLAARLVLLFLYALLAQTLFWLFGTRIRYFASYRLGLYVLPVVELLFIVWRAAYGTVALPGSYWWIWLTAMAFLAWFNRKGKLLQV